MIRSLVLGSGIALATSSFQPAPVRPTAPVEASVAVVLSTPSDASRSTISGFRRRLDQRGVHVAFEVDLTQLDEPKLQAMLQRAGVNLVFALGGRAIEIAQRAVPRAQIVSTLVVTSEELSLRRGTGVSLEFPVEVQLEWIRRILPASARRVGIIYNPAENARTVARVRALAGAHDLEIVARPVNAPSEIPQALASLTAEADVLWGLNDTVVMTPETARSILLFSMRNRLPLIGLSNAWVRAGALFALDRDYEDLGVQCAEQAVRLLQGEPVATVAPEAPRTVRYSVNQRTADQMRVRFRAQTLRGAVEVVR